MSAIQKALTTGDEKKVQMIWALQHAERFIRKFSQRGYRDAIAIRSMISDVLDAEGIERLP